MRITALISLSLLLFVSGCGYQLQGSGSILPPDVRTIAVTQTENVTSEPGLGLILTEAIRSRFERYGVVEVIDNAGAADAILSSKVVNVETGVRSVTGATDVAVELELILIVSAELKKSTGQVLWRDPQLRVSKSFATEGDVVVTSSSGFAQGGISAGSLAGLDALEVSRGQQEESFNELAEETARLIYMSAVAADF